MRNLEGIFVNELRAALKSVGYKDIFKIPLPESCKDWEVSGTELYRVMGVEKEYYSMLNSTIVKKLPKKYEAKRRKIDKASRSFKKNEDGTYVYEDFSVPSGSVVVLSDVQINLPYKEYLTCKEGYGYIDFVINNGVEYMYVLPKSVLYRANQTALVLSVKDMKNYIGGGYLTWNNGKVFLHVIPYKPNSQYVGSKVLKTSLSMDYSKEIKEVVSYWEKTRVIPPIKLCELSSDGSNLCFKSTTVGYEEYNPIEQLPLSDKEIYGEGGEASEQN